MRSPPTSRTHAAFAGALGALAVLSCATPAQHGRDSTNPGVVQSTTDSMRLAQLEREVRALVRATGCDAVGACRVAPMGSRACGGPREYVVYCAASTDSAALAVALEHLRRAEIEYNEKSGAIGTCEMRLPPELALRGGRCTATGK